MTTILYNSESGYFTLEGIVISKIDLGLLLEIHGFEVDYSIASDRFFISSLLSLKQIGEQEFREVWNLFLASNDSDKEKWRERLLDRRLARHPISYN